MQPPAAAAIRTATMTIQRQYPGRVEVPERTCDPGAAKHPAPYTDALLPIMAGLLPKGPA